MHTLTLENGQNDPLRISNKIIDSHLRQKVCMVIEFHVQLMSYFVVPRCILEIVWDKAWTTNAHWRLKWNRFEMLGPKMEDKCHSAIVKNSASAVLCKLFFYHYFVFHETKHRIISPVRDIKKRILQFTNLKCCKISLNKKNMA